MRRWAVIALVLAAAALAAACGSTSAAVEGEAASETTPAGFDPLSCDGDVAVMTTYGGFGAADTVQMNWARVALDKFNRDRGTAFTIMPLNVDADAAEAEEAARRIAANPNAIGVVGPKTSAATRAAGPILDAAGLAYISPSATNATLTDGSLRNFHRVVASDALQAPTMAEFIGQRLDPSTVLIVHDDESYSQGFASALSEKLDELKIPHRDIAIMVGQRNFDDVVALVDPTVNVVALPLLDAKDAVALVQQLWKAGKYPKIVGGDALFMKAFAVPGAYVTTYSPDSSKEDAANDLVRLYRSIFGDFEQFGAPAYVAMQVLLEAAWDVCLERGSVDRRAVTAQVPKTRLETSMLGTPIAFERNGELKGATVQVYQIGPRGFELVE